MVHKQDDGVDPLTVFLETGVQRQVWAAEVLSKFPERRLGFSDSVVDLFGVIYCKHTAKHLHLTYQLERVLGHCCGQRQRGLM